MVLFAKASDAGIATPLAISDASISSSSSASYLYLASRDPVDYTKRTIYTKTIVYSIQKNNKISIYYEIKLRRII